MFNNFSEMNATQSSNTMSASGSFSANGVDHDMNRVTNGLENGRESDDEAAEVAQSVGGSGVPAAVVETRNTIQNFRQPVGQAALIEPNPDNGDDFAQSIANLRKTAELKKHAFQLQIHTSHVLSAHAALEKGSRTLEDVRAQRNWLESERATLLEKLRKVNEDREKVDLLESSINKECSDLRTKIQYISEGDYAMAKKQVDELRHELGLAPVRPLQSILDENSASYLAQRRLQIQNVPQNTSASASDPPRTAQQSAPGPSTSTAPPISIVPKKRGPGRPPKHSRPQTGYTVFASETSATKRPRGRPRGSKNRPRDGAV